MFRVPPFCYLKMECTNANGHIIMPNIPAEINSISILFHPCLVHILVAVSIMLSEFFNQSMRHKTHPIIKYTNTPNIMLFIIILLCLCVNIFIKGAEYVAKTKRSQTFRSGPYMDFVVNLHS